MRIHIIILIALQAFICSIFSATGQVSRQDSIKYSKQLVRIEQQLMDDIPSGNSSNWNKYTAAGWFIVTEDGSMLYKKEFLAEFRGLPKGYSGYINVIKPKIVFYNNTAVISYVSDEYENVFESRIHTTYGSMNTYLRKDTSWQMISSQVFEIPALPPAIPVPASVLQKYTGIYQLSDSNTCAITLEHDTLYIQKKGRLKDVLWPETENIFFRKADTRGRKVFLPDESGNMLMRERRNGQDVIWKRISKDLHLPGTTGFFGTPENLINNFFSTMSGPAGKDRDSALFIQFYYPLSYYWHIINKTKEVDTVSVITTFTRSPSKKDTVVVSQYTRWKNDGFNERAVSIKIDRYENIAQAWVIAEVKPKETEDRKYRVQDSFQLYFDGNRWWIMSIAWQPMI